MFHSFDFHIDISNPSGIYFCVCNEVGTSFYLLSHLFFTVSGTDWDNGFQPGPMGSGLGGGNLNPKNHETHKQKSVCVCTLFCRGSINLI